MTQPLNPTITITVSGAEDAGKNRVLAIIEEALRYHLGRDIIIDAPALHTKRETHTDWSKPRSGTIFKLEEINLPENPLSRRICSMSYSEVVRLFAKYKFKDPIGHSLLSCDDFLELLELAFNHQNKSAGEIAIKEYLEFILASLPTELADKETLTDNILKVLRIVADFMDTRQRSEIEKKVIRDNTKKEYNQLKGNTLHDRTITSDDLIDRPIPVHIQTLMGKLGISFAALQEADLQPVLDLVNWVHAPEIAFQNILSETDDMMKAKRNYHIGLRLDLKKTYTLSVKELSSHKALEKLEWAINRIKCDPGSYFAEGEINAMFIGDVRATSTEPNYGIVKLVNQPDDQYK